MSTSVARRHLRRLTDVRLWALRLNGSGPHGATGPWLRATALVVILGAALQVLRRINSAPLSTLYAEDGQIFLVAAVTKSPAAALAEPYMGYFHLVPRSIAEITAVTPLAWAPAIMAISAGVVVALTALVVYHASADHLATIRARGLLALAVLLVPVGAAEVADNLANLHWYLIFASFWVLLWRPSTWLGVVSGCAVLLGATLSDPLSALLAPVLAVRLAFWRRPIDAFTSVWVTGLVIQGLAIILQHAHRVFNPTAGPAQLAAWYAQNVLTRGLFGSFLVGGAHSLRAIVLTIATILMLCFLAWLAWGSGTWTRRPMAMVAAGMSGVLYLVPVSLTGVAAPRYSVAPALLLLSAIAIVVEDLQRVRAGTGRAVAAVAVIVATVACLTNVLTPRTSSPSWQAALGVARADCRSQPPAARETLDIAPAGWTVTLPCSTLAGHR